jgi:hypothetical protein
MKKTLATLGILIASILLGLTACGPKEESFDVLEQQRSIASENAKFNAVRYRAEYWPTATIYSRGDSTQSKTCPQGDGWASIDLLEQGKVVAELKCSTVSGNIACMTGKDFKARAQYAEQDGKCNGELPYPLKKLGS